jgi:hypothetical protein
VPTEIEQRNENGGEVEERERADHVEWCAARCLSHGRFDKMLCKSKVSVLDNGILRGFREKKILRFNISMDDVFTVKKT